MIKPQSDMKIKLPPANTSKFLIGLSLFLLITTKAFAVSPTPTVTPTPTAKISPTITVSEEPDASASADQMREWAKQKARELIQKTMLGQKKAYVGKILTIQDNLLTLETRNGDKEAQVATDAAVLVTGKGNSTLAKIKTGDFAIAMGYIVDNEILDTRRLVSFAPPKAATREVAFGKVADISSDNEEILTVVNEKLNTTYSIEVTEETDIISKLTGKSQTLNFYQIKLNDQLVAIGTESSSDKKIITATTIQILSTTPKTSPTPTVAPTSSPTP